MSNSVFESSERKEKSQAALTAIQLSAAGMKEQLERIHKPANTKGIIKHPTLKHSSTSQPQRINKPANHEGFINQPRTGGPILNHHAHVGSIFNQYYPNVGYHKGCGS